MVYHSIQIPVDIMEGITDAQAREMAKNLEFEGAALEEVNHILKK